MAGMVVRGEHDSLTAFGEKAAVAIGSQIPPGCDLVMESMKVMVAALSKGDPQDLLDVQTVGAFCAGALRGSGIISTNVELIQAVSWKRNIPADIQTARILDALSSNERALVETATKRVRPRARNLDHNILDACGILLVKCGRLRS